MNNSWKGLPIDKVRWRILMTSLCSPTRGNRCKPTLPSGVYHSHRQFLRVCYYTADQYNQEIDQLNSTLQTLCKQVDDGNELAQRETQLLNGITSLQPPSLPIVSGNCNLICEHSKECG
ncbi:unnamed protein product [Schistosoma margrebowiei]|uniref:Uncharacterized protein n=1 Tax=Schistosoma margrebowiei TaxID=48269 RepID=A0A183NC25_9TREM|nr:unnamed protein product [Schistosoma margrebowiei]